MSGRFGLFVFEYLWNIWVEFIYRDRWMDGWMDGWTDRLCLTEYIKYIQNMVFNTAGVGKSRMNS